MNSHKLMFHGLDELPLDKPRVMAILNATPDSFSDGGEINNQQVLAEKIKALVEANVDIIDIGGESTRPGHQKISASEEINRILPVIASVRKLSKTIPISVDSQKAEVAEKALQVGANFINDVSALSDPQMANVATKFNCSIVLMRSHALSKNIISSCKDQFSSLIDKATSAGLKKTQIILDPGLGFGDLTSGDYSSLPGGNASANFELILKASELSAACPILIGASRKRFIGMMSNESEPRRRDAPSYMLNIIAACKGAEIIRVHDAVATKKALDQLF